MGFLPWLFSSFLLAGSVLACVLLFLGLASSSFGFSSFCFSCLSFLSSFFAGLLLASFFEGSAALSVGFTFAFFSSCLLAAVFTSLLHPSLLLAFTCFEDSTSLSLGFASSCWLPSCLLTVAPFFEDVDPSSSNLEPFVFASLPSAFFALFTDAAATTWFFSSFFFSFNVLLPALLLACASFFGTSCSLGFLPWLFSSFLLAGSVLACVLLFLCLASSSFGFFSFCFSCLSFLSSFFAGLLLASFFEGSAALSVGFTFAFFSSCFLAAVFTSLLHPSPLLAFTCFEEAASLSLGFASCFASFGFASCFSSPFLASASAFFFSFLFFLSFLLSLFFVSFPPPSLFRSALAALLSSSFTAACKICLFLSNSSMTFAAFGSIELFSFLIFSAWQKSRGGTANGSGVFKSSWFIDNPRRCAFP